ncbi:MAG: nucleotidyltransferase domain-containing protein [Nanoarchaeota archaeon]
MNEKNKNNKKEEKDKVNYVSKNGSMMPAIPNIPKSIMNMPNPPVVKAPALQIDFNALRDKLETFKKNLAKKYSFTMALVLLPVPAYPIIEEDEALPLEIIESKPIHMMMVIPEEQYKNIPKIKAEVVKMVKETKENIWVHLKTPVDLWNYGLDSKFDLVDAVAQGFPLYDKGFLGALRVASIHKTLVLRKFDKYVASYVIGGSLVRGTAGKDSDVDVFVIIDDTDVKRMSRVELSERLRGMIYDYIREATALAGVKNILNVQVWLLTDFWQRVKDAEPVAFTFIRDGIPLWDRGTFIPWKLLLKMGKIKPSSEAIDLYMKQGEQTEEFVKRRLLDAMVDIYYSIVTPTQALMMLAGAEPPVPKTIVQDVKKILVERDKVMSEKDLKILEKAVHLFKQYEYGKLKGYPGKEVDQFMKESKEYNNKLKKLRKNLEKKMQEKDAESIYDGVFKLLKTFFGNKNQTELVKDFESKMVKKGKILPRFLNILNELVKAKGKIKSGKLTQKEVDRVKKDAFEFMDVLVEYGQRTDLIKGEKGMMLINYAGNRKAELVLLGKDNFIIEGNEIRKIGNEKFVKSDKKELEKALEENKGKLKTKLSGEIFNVLKKELGDFEVEF